MEKSSLTEDPEHAHGVPSAPQDRRTCFCIVRDLDPELETDREKDKRDGRDRDEDDVDPAEIIRFHYTPRKRKNRS